MGCAFGKSSAIEGSREKPLDRGSSSLHVSRVTSSRRGESFRAKERLYSGDLRVGLTDKKSNVSNRVRDDYFQKEGEDTEVVVINYPAIRSIPKATEGEQVAAGWPSWLAEVAGEAIKGWIPRQADTFEKIDKIGEGTYSSVFKARDLTHKKVVALKRVRFDNKDPGSIKFMAREILILRRLDHPNIINLEGLVTSRTSCSLYLVLEYMEHDLTGLASLPGVRFSEPQIKCYVQQLLSGLNHCHTRGVLHRDIKGSNLLIDNHGILKIADFGLASFYNCEKSIPLTSRVVTLWYRPPELILGATHYGVSVDLWSTGCIVGELFARKPIMPGRTEVEQLHKIFKLCGSPTEDYWRKSKLPPSTVFKPVLPYKRRLKEAFKDLPPSALGLIETLLSVDPAQRGTAATALKNEYFTTEPLACDPSCLPKYPPSKEIDAKLRDEEVRRKGGAGDRRQGFEREAGGPKLPRAIPVPNANAELVTSMQRKQGNSASKSQSERFNPSQVEDGSGLPVNPPRQTQGGKEMGKDLTDNNPRRAFQSGPLVPGFGRPKTGKICKDMASVSSRADLSTLASRKLVSDDCQDKFGPSEPEKGRETILHGHGFKGNNIHFSGPLLVPSTNMDQMLKEHDRRIQEAARRARLEKERVGIVQATGVQAAADPLYISGRGAG